MKSAEIKRSAKRSLHLARAKRQRAFMRKLVLVSAALIFLSVLALYGLYRPAVNIQSVIVEGTRVLRPADIEASAFAELSGKYFYLIPKTSYFFFPEEKLLAKLRDSFKRIDSISVSRSGFTKLFINLSERPERYLWCGRDFLQNRKPYNDCYFVDSGGYVFSKSPYYSGNIFFEFYGPLASGQNTEPLGGTVLSEDNFEKLVAFRDSLGVLGIPPIKIFINTEGDYELYLPISGKVLVSSKSDLTKDVEYLRLALATEPLKTQMETGRNKLDYLDVRFGNKVYFKFK